MTNAGPKSVNKWDGDCMDSYGDDWVFNSALTEFSEMEPSFTMKERKVEVEEVVAAWAARCEREDA